MWLWLLVLLFVPLNNHPSLLDDISIDSIYFIAIFFNILFHILVLN